MGLDVPVFLLSLVSCYFFQHILHILHIFLWLNLYLRLVLNGYIHIYACGPKTVPVKRTFLNIAIVGWGGGGHVNVPCTSYMKYCHAAEISGIVYYVTCCYAADGVGWAGLGWGGVGWAC